MPTYKCIAYKSTGLPTPHCTSLPGLGVPRFLVYENRQATVSIIYF